MILIVLAALASELPPLPQMPASVSGAYMKYNWCIADAAKFLAGRRGESPDLFPIAKDACATTRMQIEAALDVEAASMAAEFAADGVPKDQPSIPKHLASSDAMLTAIDRRLEVMFAAHLKIYRTEEQ